MARRPLVMVATVLLTAWAAVVGVPTASAQLPVDQVGVTEPAAGNAFIAALDQCRSILALTGTLEMEGSVHRQRVHSRMRVATMLSAATRIESLGPADRQPFVVSASGEQAMVLLPDERVAVTGQPASAVFETVLGLPLSAEDVHRVLACPQVSGSFSGGWRLSDKWLKVVIAGDRFVGEAYLSRDKPSEPWELAAMIGRYPARGTGWRAEFHDRRGPYWRRIRLASVDWSGATGMEYDVELSLDDVQINPGITPAALAVSVPSSFRTTSLDEIRVTGPVITRRLHK